MNNLKQQIIDSTNSSHLLTGVTCLTIDTDLNVIYGVNHEKHLISIDVNNNSIKDCCHLSPSDESVNAICVQFLSEERCVCTALTNGDLINFNTITNDKQFVGSLSDGLDSVSFSLDQELIVLLTQKSSLILMNKLFDILAKRDLNTDEFGVNKAVSLNWGAKSTQFHGEGKRDFRSDEQDLHDLSCCDDKKSRISWRGDGLYFVTSSIDSKTNNRKLQVWSRDAILQYSSEYVCGLEQLICWRPSGNLIASSQLLPNKHLIIFFEKNGLKHGEFELPFIPKTFEVKHISWSCDSQILLILGLESINETPKQVLMLWRQSNYHWYLKKSLQFTNDLIVSIIWDSIDPTMLHIMLDNGQYVKYRWKWSVDVFDGKVAVIDGKRLRISNFDESVIPPPFCSYSFDIKSQIVEICVSRSTLAVVLINDTILLFEKKPEVKINDDSNYFSVSYENVNKELSHVFECFYANTCEGVANLTNFVISQSNIVYGINANQLVCFDFRNNSAKLDTILNLTDKVIGMSCKENIIAIVQIDGKLMKIDTKTQAFSQWTDKNENPVVFAQQCCQLELFKLEDRIFSICLSENLTLYLDNKVISQNCNSFVIFNDRFLLFSTTDHLLHCWPLNQNIFDINKNYQKYSPRSVERGSKIIADSVGDAKIVLQMPRGNLEAIHPRMLLLDSVMSKLDRLEFDLAFELLRKHRINLNFLYDYNTQNFNNNINIFITQIAAKSVQWICLFLTDLSNENIYVKLCSDNIDKMSNTSIPKSDNSPNKIDMICDSMRASMDEMDSNKFLHPILLTYIKKSVPETDSALKRIKAIDDIRIRDEAIKFLLYIININTLFEEALGTYDFQILLMIASKSQKDPKEYLALLEELNVYESFDYKCYKIDMYLKRYKKALTHLFKCDQHFEECLELIQTHSLYRDAIALSQNSDSQLKNRIWKLYAEYLLNKRYFEESAIAFKRCNDFVNAVKAYQLSGNWNGAIDAALHCPDVVNIETLARNLAKHLASIGKYSDASYLFEVYVKDPKEGIKTLIDGHEWEHAIRLINQFKDEDILQYLHSELRNHFEFTIDIITTNHKNLLKYKNRLQIVRLEKTERNLDLNNFDNFDSKSDIYSDTSSLSDSNSSSQRSTSSSLATKKSKRNVKKLEKKKYIWKEGSADEDIQLIFAINEIIKNCDGMQEEVSILIRTLYQFYYIEESNKIQIEFSILLDLIHIIIKDIWLQSDPQNQLNDFSHTHQISDPELSKVPVLRRVDWKLAFI